MIGLLGGYAKEPKELAVDLKVWKVELEKQIACMETNETKMMERADQEAHQQNLWDRILRSTVAPVAATTLAREVSMSESSVAISTSAPTTLSPVAVMTAIDDGDDDLIVTSKPKSGDGLNVFVADLGNAGSYVNAVRKIISGRPRGVRTWPVSPTITTASAGRRTSSSTRALAL